MNKRLLRGIYKRRNIFWLAIQKDKKRHFISLHTSDPYEAVRQASKLRHGPEITSGDLLNHAVDRFIRWAQETGHWTANTVDAKGCTLRKFAEWCGSRAFPHDVDAGEVLAYHKMRCRLRSPRTAFGNVMTIRSFFNWCRDTEKTVRENPCQNLMIKAPPNKGRENFCTPELVDKLIRECTREDLKFILYCGFHCGLRAQEIVEARPFWFDLDGPLPEEVV